jgi:hypothetical protein
MKLGFVFATQTAANDTSWHAALPRPMRKALRHVRVSTLPKPQTHVGVDEYLRTGYKADAYHNQNLVDVDPFADEFGDIDDEFAGLTIVEAMGEAELFEFCTGYNII